MGLLCAITVSMPEETRIGKTWSAFTISSTAAAVRMHTPILIYMHTLTHTQFIPTSEPDQRPVRLPLFRSLRNNNKQCAQQQPMNLVSWSNKKYIRRASAPGQAHLVRTNTITHAHQGYMHCMHMYIFSMWRSSIHSWLNAHVFWYSSHWMLGAMWSRANFTDACMCCLLRPA